MYCELNLDRLSPKPSAAINAFIHVNLRKFVNRACDGYLLRTCPDQEECFQEFRGIGRPAERMMVGRAAAEETIECLGHNSSPMYVLGKPITDKEVEIVGSDRRRLAYMTFKAVKSSEQGNVGHLLFLRGEEFNIETWLMQELTTYDPGPLTIDVAALEFETVGGRLLKQELARLADKRSGRYSLTQLPEVFITANYSETINTYGTLTAQLPRKSWIANELVEALDSLVGSETRVKLVNGEKTGTISIKNGTKSAFERPFHGVILTRTDWTKPKPAELRTTTNDIKEQAAEGWQTWQDDKPDFVDEEEPTTYDLRLEEQARRPVPDENWF